jgi:hypothetical protein
MILIMYKMFEKSEAHASIYINESIESDLHWFLDDLRKSDGVLFFQSLDWDPFSDADDVLRRVSQEGYPPLASLRLLFPFHLLPFFDLIASPAHVLVQVAGALDADLIYVILSYAPRIYILHAHSGRKSEWISVFSQAKLLGLACSRSEHNSEPRAVVECTVSSPLKTDVATEKDRIWGRECAKLLSRPDTRSL